ncbi:MAG: sulfotransferase domain-containing protein, partial [Rhodospirillaceae bacterium]|nr:sulfotransferase domain-containing protein [Rhodospirillaceae bacterium]
TTGDSIARWFTEIDPRPATEFSQADLARLRPQAHARIAECTADSALVKTHNALVQVAGVPMITRAVTAGVIYLVRNPLDVVLSYADHLGQKVDDVIALLAEHGFESPATDKNVPEHHSDWSSHVASWTEVTHPALHIARYEDMVSEPLATFGAIVGFLGLPPDQDRLSRAIEFSSFKVLRDLEDQTGFVERTPVQKNFFRAGKSGGWRKQLSAAQVRRVIEVHREQMERFDYVPKGY